VFLQRQRRVWFYFADLSILDVLLDDRNFLSEGIEKLLHGRKASEV